MAAVRISLTIPEDVLDAVDAAAGERGESRSSFVSRLLCAAMRARSDAEVTRRFDEIFSDPAIAAEQLRVAHELDLAGAEWSEERW